jgi:hypothetical protein
MEDLLFKSLNNSRVEYVTIKWTRIICLLFSLRFENSSYVYLSNYRGTRYLFRPICGMAPMREWYICLSSISNSRMRGIIHEYKGF